jgi:hypothetical protein
MGRNEGVGRIGKLGLALAFERVLLKRLRISRARDKSFGMNRLRG